jgi:hypothetical protein
MTSRLETGKTITFFHCVYCISAGPSCFLFFGYALPIFLAFLLLSDFSGLYCGIHLPRLCLYELRSAELYLHKLHMHDLDNIKFHLH